MTENQNATQAQAETQALDSQAQAPAPQEAAPQAEAPQAQTTPNTPSILAEAAKEEAPAPASEAPEQYEPFKTPDGFVVPAESVEAFAKGAKELGLSQEKAQKFFEHLAPTYQGYMEKTLTEQAASWAKASQEDPEFGGAKFKESLGIAGQAYQQYATPELRKILDASGLGNHPEVIRMFLRIGREMSQDSGVTGQRKQETVVRRYPNSNMIP